MALTLSLAIITALTLPSFAGEAGPFLSDRSQLAQALADKAETIYVDDMDFAEGDLYLTIRQSVRIVGREKGSTLRRAHFLIDAPAVESELITVSFENIIFDGCYVSPDGDPGKAESFDAFYGDRARQGCLEARGFLELTVKNCSFRNYCARSGAALNLNYSDGNSDIGTRLRLDIRGCQFTGNICEKGVLWLNGKNTPVSIADCTFTGNRCFSGIMVIGSARGTLENITIRDNRRTVFTEKNTYYISGGGGMLISRSELLIRGCTVDGCSAPAGGAIQVTNSPVTIADCRITNNSADKFGGGIEIQSAEQSPVYITNTYFSGNSAPQEGALMVMPADQIGIGLPTGITEVSFCTFEGNISRGETFVFHPIQLESPKGTEGQPGKIDFIACRISDENVTAELKNGENYNVINSSERGPAVPREAAAAVARGYYGDLKDALYPGVNELKKPVGGKAVMYVLAALCVLAVAAGVTLLVLRRLRRSAPEPEKEPVEDKLAALAEERGLTRREADVLREYLAGKSRTEIGQSLFISESTVKNHVSSIFSKLGVKNRRELLELTGKNK
ncbi:MAG: right-handed parallel beta-helix repeat-containing protein [Oscillospiraceae bacterium]|nr:right-handed parallel beta-helix repeat-containing protein [Oscillospiraceae bacterium]